MSTQTASPDVSIILPVFNDAEWVATALRSCLNQTLGSIEVIVVDDASTDETASIVEEFIATDARVRLLRQGTNQSAFQARRAGILASTAPYILFLDGDDELVPHAAASALTIARDESADVVAFGCQVVKPDGSTGGDYEAAMQPTVPELIGEDIIATLFPVGKTAQGQLWRYLFSRDLLAAAYESLPSELVLPRANDLPIAFLALMRARKYVSTPMVLYRYFFRRGASGHRLVSMDDYRFMSSAIDSIESIAQAVEIESEARDEPSLLVEAYESARLSVTGRVLDYVWGIADLQMRAECVNLLTERVGPVALVAACADFCSKALPLLAKATEPPVLSERDVQHVVIRASNLGTGGAQGVVIAQAKHLAQAGFAVTIAVDSAPDTHFRLPEGVQAVQVVGESRGQKLTNFAAFCEENRVDVIIDHYVLYNDRWPYFAISAAAGGIPTIGWLHNFALRPIVDGSTRLSFLEQYLPLLATIVVLSEADVAYWKLRGLPRVVYLPNPASPLLEHLPPRSSPRTSPSDVLEIVWWGRLQQATKQVREFVEIGSALRDLDIDFRLTIIGPDGPDLTAAQLHEAATARGIDDRLVILGPLHGDALVTAIDHAHVFLNTSIIEGYPLALVEAQALGLPIVMYSLPWLAALKGNRGVVAVEQGDRRAAAQALALLASDPEHYREVSSHSLDSAADALAHDFEALYTDLLRGTLAPVYSPDPTPATMTAILDQNVQFVERHIRRERRSVDRARTDARAQRDIATQLRRDLKTAASQLEESRADAERQRREASRERERALDLARQLEEYDSFAEVPQSPVQANSPSVPRTGFKGWVHGLLPASMRQASFYARHQHSVVTALHTEVLASQAAVQRHLKRIDATLLAVHRDRYKNAEDALTSVNGLTDSVSRLSSVVASDIASLRESSDARASEIEGTLNQIATVGPRVLHAAERLSEVATAESVARAVESGIRPLASIVDTASELAQQLTDLGNSVNSLVEEVHGAVTESDTSARLGQRSAGALRKVGRAVDEVLWADVFHDTTSGSDWFTDRALSPGRWAVGYPFLYVLYRVLDEVRPTSVLELGLGQSTKLIAQYVSSADASHKVVEHDPEWIEVFAANYALPSTTRIAPVTITEENSSDRGSVRRYEGFSAVVGSELYDLIVIDGPYGYGQDLARIDVLDILPECLSERFVIMLDDANRPGEQATSRLIVEMLDRAGIAHATGTYRGQKDIWIAVSADLAFLTTL